MYSSDVFDRILHDPRSCFRACVLLRQCDLASIGSTLVCPHVSLDVVFSALPTTYWACSMAPLMLNSLVPCAIFLYGESLLATLGTCEADMGLHVALKECRGCEGAWRFLRALPQAHFAHESWCFWDGDRAYRVVFGMLRERFRCIGLGSTG